VDEEYNDWGFAAADLEKAERHEQVGRLHLEVARLMRGRDQLRVDNHRMRCNWDASMRLLEDLADRLAAVQAGDFPQFAQFASAEWAVDNLADIRSLLAVWRADIEGPF